VGARVAAAGGAAAALGPGEMAATRQTTPWGPAGRPGPVAVAHTNQPLTAPQPRLARTGLGAAAPGRRLGCRPALRVLSASHHCQPVPGPRCSPRSALWPLSPGLLGCARAGASESTGLGALCCHGHGQYHEGAEPPPSPRASAADNHSASLPLAPALRMQVRARCQVRNREATRGAALPPSATTGARAGRGSWTRKGLAARRDRGHPSRGLGFERPSRLAPLRPRRALQITVRLGRRCCAATGAALLRPGDSESLG
jgi:hypothetical protein